MAVFTRNTYLSSSLESWTMDPECAAPTLSGGLLPQLSQLKSHPTGEIQAFITFAHNCFESFPI